MSDTITVDLTKEETNFLMSLMRQGLRTVAEEDFEGDEARLAEIGYKLMVSIGQKMIDAAIMDGKVDMSSHDVRMDPRDE